MEVVSPGKVMEKIGNAIGSIGYTIAIASGIWGYGLSLFVLLDWGGFLAVLAGLLLFPFAFTIAPFYAGFWLDDWAPFIASYVVPAIGCAFMWVGLFVVPACGKRDEG